MADPAAQECRMLRSQLAAMELKFSQQSRTQQELNILLNRMHIDLGKAAVEKDSYEITIEGLRQNIDELKSVIKEKDLEKEDIKRSENKANMALGAMKAESEEKLGAMKADRKKLAQRIDRLEADKQEIVLDFTGRAKDYEVTRRRNKELETQLDELKNAFDTERSKTEGISEGLGVMQDEFEQLRNECIEQQKTIAILSKQRDEAVQLREQAVTDRREQQTESSKKFSDYSDQNKKLSEELSQFTVEVKQLRQDLEYAQSNQQTLQRERDESIAQFNIARGRIQTLEDMYEESSTRLEASRAEVDELKASIMKERKSSEGTLARMMQMKEIESTESVKRHEQELHGRIADAVRNALHEAETKFSHEKDGMNKQIREAKREASTLHSALESVETALSETKRSLSTEIERRKALSRDLRSTQGDLSSQLDEALVKIKTLEVQYDTEKNRVRDVNTQLHDAQVDLQLAGEHKQRMNSLLLEKDLLLTRERDARLEVLQRLRHGDDEKQTISSQRDVAVEEASILRKQLKDLDRKLASDIDTRNQEIERLKKRNHVLSESITRLASASSSSSMERSHDNSIRASINNASTNSTTAAGGTKAAGGPAISSSPDMPIVSPDGWLKTFFGDFGKRVDTATDFQVLAGGAGRDLGLEGETVNDIIDTAAEIKDGGVGVGGAVYRGRSTAAATSTVGETTTSRGGGNNFPSSPGKTIILSPGAAGGSSPSGAVLRRSSPSGAVLRRRSVGFADEPPLQYYSSSTSNNNAANNANNAAATGTSAQLRPAVSAAAVSSVDDPGGGGEVLVRPSLLDSLRSKSAPSDTTNNNSTILRGSSNSPLLRSSKILLPSASDYDYSDYDGRRGGGGSGSNDHAPSEFGAGEEDENGGGGSDGVARGGDDDWEKRLSSMPPSVRSFFEDAAAAAAGNSAGTSSTNNGTDISASISSRAFTAPSANKTELSAMLGLRSAALRTASVAPGGQYRSEGERSVSTPVRGSRSGGKNSSSTAWGGGMDCYGDIDDGISAAADITAVAAGGDHTNRTASTYGNSMDIVGAALRARAQKTNSSRPHSRANGNYGEGGGLTGDDGNIFKGQQPHDREDGDDSHEITEYYQRNLVKMQEAIDKRRQQSANRLLHSSYSSATATPPAANEGLYNSAATNTTLINDSTSSTGDDSATQYVSDVHHRHSPSKHLLHYTHITGSADTAALLLTSPSPSSDRFPSSPNETQSPVKTRGTPIKSPLSPHSHSQSTSSPPATASVPRRSVSASFTAAAAAATAALLVQEEVNIDNTIATAAAAVSPLSSGVSTSSQNKNRLLHGDNSRWTKPGSGTTSPSPRHMSVLSSAERSPTAVASAKAELLFSLSPSNRKIPKSPSDIPTPTPPATTATTAMESATIDSGVIGAAGLGSSGNISLGSLGLKSPTGSGRATRSDSSKKTTKKQSLKQKSGTVAAKGSVVDSTTTAVATTDIATLTATPPPPVLAGGGGVRTHYSTPSSDHHSQQQQRARPISSGSGNGGSGSGSSFAQKVRGNIEKGKDTELPYSPAPRRLSTGTDHGDIEFSPSSLY